MQFADWYSCYLSNADLRVFYFIAVRI